MYVSRREQLQLFAREYRDDADDANDDIVFDEKGAAQEDGDKLEAPPLKTERENHEFSSLV